MDREQIRRDVFEKTGLRIAIDDPAFITVALNEQVIEACSGKLLSDMESAASKINVQIGMLIKVGEAIRTEQAKLAKEAKEHLASATKAAREDTIKDVKKTAYLAADEAATKAIDRVIDERMAGVVRTMETTAKTLVMTAKTTTSLPRLIALVFFAAVSGGLVTPFAQSGLNAIIGTNAQHQAADTGIQLSEKDQQNLIIGKRLNASWPQLDQKTRAKLSAILNKNEQP